MFKIRKKDKVRIISGKDKGKEGEVLKALPKEGKLFVAGVNIAFRHLKPVSLKSRGFCPFRKWPLFVKAVRSR